MSNKLGIIIAGDKIHAGIDKEDVTEIENCVVIHFEEKEDMKKFMESTQWYQQD